jgi:deoxyguanosine kinase
LYGIALRVWRRQQNRKVELKLGKYIAIEGNIGAGKTTLAQMLAQRLNARLVLEQFADNPFLEEFYTSPERWAFTVEMAFMAERYAQLSGILTQSDLFQPDVVSDYHPLKSKLFASVNLSPKEFRLYSQFFDALFSSIRGPDLIIFIRAELPTLMSNIKSRGRSFEQNIPSEYLLRLSEEYKNFLKMVTTPTITLVRESFDFIGNDQHLELLIQALLRKDFTGNTLVSGPDELAALV